MTDSTNQNKSFDKVEDSVTPLDADTASYIIQLFAHLGNGGSFTLNGNKTISVTVTPDIYVSGTTLYIPSLYGSVSGATVTVSKGSYSSNKLTF